MMRTAQSDVGQIERVLLKHPRDAWISQGKVDAEWQSLNYLARPDFEAALREFDALVACLEQAGATVEFLPVDEATGIDSIYVRDATIVSDGGVIRCEMGKGARSGEPNASTNFLASTDLLVGGAITPGGTIEGGDVTWLDTRTLAVGRGYRTNDEGITQLKALLPADVEVIEVPLPHWQGPGDVFHLMSMVSPVATKTLLVYSPLLPVPFREMLLARGFSLVEVPTEEFESMGCNVLAIEPDHCLMLEGNPVTASRLNEAGLRVTTYAGDEISRKGCGGPTCLTRPLVRQC